MDVQITGAFVNQRKIKEVFILTCFVSGARFETVYENSVPLADPSVELHVRSFVACALKCRQRRAFSFALLAPQTDSTQRRCFIYDDDVTVRPMMTSEGSIYVASILSLKLISSQQV